MQLSLSFLDVAAIEEISVAVWENIFDTVGWPSSLNKKTFGHADISEALQRDELSDKLLLALEAISSLGTEEGREAIDDAMKDRRVQWKEETKDLGSREFAARIFLLQMHDIVWSDVFSRAQIRVGIEGKNRGFHEFVGDEARSVSNYKQRLDLLGEEVKAHCKHNGLGEHVQVEGFEDHGGYVFQVIHSSRTKTPLAIVESQTARSLIKYRPVECDVLHYDSMTGRLRVTVRMNSLVGFYQRLVGEMLFDDVHFFFGVAACTLKPLQKNGRRALEAQSTLGIGQVRMTECVWRRGDRSIHEIRSSDCFDDIEELKLPLREEGELLQVKLKIQVPHEGRRPVTVTIRVPGKVKISGARWEGLVNQYLEDVGIRAKAEPGREHDLWSLYPWRHPEPIWRGFFGRVTDDLVQSGALKRVQLDSVPGQTDGAPYLKVEPVGNGEHYGVGASPEVSSRSLSETDIEGLELKPEKYREHLRAELGLAGSAEPWSGEEYLDLGSITIGECEFRPFYMLRAPGEDLARRLREHAASPYRAVLLPSGRKSSTQDPEFLLARAVPTKESLERELVLACKLESQVPAVYYAPKGTRLVVDRNHQGIWVDGVKIGDIGWETQAFDFVVMLAGASPRNVSVADICHTLSGAREDGTAVARQAKRLAKKAILDGLALAGRELGMKDPFQSSTGAYRCALPAFVV